METCQMATRETRPSRNASAFETLAQGIKYSCILLMALIGVLLLVPSLAKGREPPARVSVPDHSDHCANPDTTPDATLESTPPCDVGEGLQTGQRQSSWTPRVGVLQPPSRAGIRPEVEPPREAVPTATKTTVTGEAPRSAPGPTVRRRWWYSGAAIPQWLWTGWMYVPPGRDTDRPDRPWCTARTGIIASPPASTYAPGMTTPYSLFLSRSELQSREANGNSTPFTLQLLSTTSYDPKSCNVAPAVCWPRC
jgi:hypothetical protein